MATNYVRVKCPTCGHEFGQEKRFLKHHLEVHGSPADECLYVRHVLGGVRPVCGCGCGKNLPWVGWKKGYTSKFLRGHNAVIDSCWNDPKKQREMADKRLEGFATGKYKVWNNGLTKETDERVAAISEKVGESLREGYASGSLVSWQTGLTKETDERIARAGFTRSEGMRNGRIKNWSSGLTKETDERLARAAAAIGSAARTANRLSIDEVQHRFDELCGDKFTLVSPLTAYENKYTKLEFRCTTCGGVSLKNMMMLRATPVCFMCHPKESRGQIEMHEFVKSLVSDVVMSNRSVLGGRELDIFVPSRKFAIEYNGLYWHSVACQSDRMYHENKCLAAQAAGIKLLHVFEDEWRDKRHIIESMIRNALQLNSRRTFARKCSAREITVAERRSFFGMCHIDGDCRSTRAWGLFVGDDLVSALSVRRPFHVDRYSDAIEIGRFASSLDTTVVGGLGKLVSLARDYARGAGARRLISYADSRVGNGDSYARVGFTDIGRTSPRFWWTDFVNRYNRFGIRADKSRGITQAQAAEAAGVIEIWGCGNRIFEMVV